MFLKKYKLNKFLIILALTFFIAPSLQASATCFSCCPQGFMSEAETMKDNDSACHDLLEINDQHFSLDYDCNPSETAIMICCLDKNNSRLASDDNNKRPENNLIISSAVSDFNHGLLINNNYAVAYISFIAPPPQLEPLSSILKRE